jgi:L-asparaginase
LAEDRVVPLMMPVRDWKPALRAATGASPAARLAKASSPPVALVWLGMGEAGGLLEALLTDPRHLGYGGVVIGAMGGGHVPEPLVAGLVAHVARQPVVIASRTGGGPLLRRTYEGPGSEISLRAAGLVFAGRLAPVKARLMLDVLLRAGAGREAIAAAFDATG